MLRQDRGSSTQLWIWKLGLISDLRTSELLPCSVSHTLAPPRHHTLLIWGGGAGIPGHPAHFSRFLNVFPHLPMLGPPRPHPECPSLCAAARQVITLPASASDPCLLPTAAFGMCHYCSLQVLPVFTASPSQCSWEAADSRQRLGEFGSGHLPTQAQATCQPSQFQLFSCLQKQCH